MKNKYLIFSLIILLAYIVACAPAQKGTITPKPAPAINQPTASIEPKQEISSDVKELLDKSKTKVKNIYYKYRGPETEKLGNNIFDFYVKGTKVKYLPYREIKALDKPESYNSVYIDTIAKTAQTYCDDRACIYKGKKGDLNYNDAYIQTIFDWINGLTKAVKVGEEVIDDRNVWKIDTNKGTMWIDTFYGIPLKIDSSGKKYRFEQIAVNSVEDADVTPS